MTATSTYRYTDEQMNVIMRIFRKSNELRLKEKQKKTYFLSVF